MSYMHTRAFTRREIRTMIPLASFQECSQKWLMRETTPLFGRTNNFSTKRYIIDISIKILPFLQFRKCIFWASVILVASKSKGYSHLRRSGDFKSFELPCRNPDCTKQFSREWYQPEKWFTAIIIHSREPFFIHQFIFQLWWYYNTQFKPV